MQGMHLLVALLATTFFMSCSPQPIVRVGRFEIREFDAQNRAAILRAQGIQNSSADIGLLQLVQAYQTAAVLEANGHLVTDDRLAAESRRIDSETRSPEVLNQIKAVFGQDHDNYLRTLVLPTYVERTIFVDFFPNAASIHGPQLERFKVWHKQILANPKSLAVIAQGIKAYYRLELSEESGFVWSDLNAAPAKRSQSQRADSANKIIDQSPGSEARAKVERAFNEQGEMLRKQEANKWIQNVAKKLKPGQIFEQVIDEEGSFTILKFLGTSKNVYQFEALREQKTDYGHWVESEKKKISVVWLDPAWQRRFEALVKTN